MRAREVCEIRVRGILGGSSSDWLEGLAVSHPAWDETVLSGPNLDQSALQAMLGKILDYNVKLISINLAPPHSDAQTD